MYQRAWLVASASLAEGWGLTLTEAAACGTPSVATDISGHRSSVVDGVTGVLVEPQRPPALADALVAVITDPARRQRLAQAGQTRMARDFGMQSNLARLAVKFGLRVPPGYVSTGP